MATIFVIYAGFVLWRGWDFLQSGQLVAVGLGLAVLVLTIVALLLVWRDVQFGLRTQRMAQSLGQEPSGDFDNRTRAVQDSPDDWQWWYALGVAYFDAGDKRKAREVLGHAWRLYRRSPAGA